MERLTKKNETSERNNRKLQPINREPTFSVCFYLKKKERKKNRRNNQLDTHTHTHRMFNSNVCYAQLCICIRCE